MQEEQKNDDSVLTPTHKQWIVSKFKIKTALKVEHFESILQDEMFLSMSLAQKKRASSMIMYFAIYSCDINNAEFMLQNFIIDKNKHITGALFFRRSSVDLRMQEWLLSKGFPLPVYVELKCKWCVVKHQIETLHMKFCTSDLTHALVRKDSYEETCYIITWFFERTKEKTMFTHFTHFLKRYSKRFEQHDDVDIRWYTACKNLQFFVKMFSPAFFTSACHLFANEVPCNWENAAYRDAMFCFDKLLQTPFEAQIQEQVDAEQIKFMQLRDDVKQHLDGLVVDDIIQHILLPYL